VLKDFFHCWSLIWVLLEKEVDEVVNILASTIDIGMLFLGYFLLKNLLAILKFVSSVSKRY
jgi:hypothetical protein